MSRKITVRVLSAFLALLTVIGATACAGKEKLATKPLALIHETKFGGAYLEPSLEEFAQLGFEFGDSVDVKFSNGEKLEDIPYYDGYYVRTGAPLIVAYPGYPHPSIRFNNGPSTFETFGLTEDDTAVVTLRERGKYLSVQESMNMVYTNERENYSSDEVFANFRVMTGGRLAEGMFYRSASPCDDQYNRAEYSSALAEKAGIGFILDLADSEEETDGYYADEALGCAYWKSLYEDGKVYPMDMASAFMSDEYIAKVAGGMRQVIANDGPYLIHCTEGKDRTGFVCMLVEALAGASKDELEADYMKTYDNYYGVNEKDAPDGYNAVVDVKFGDMLCLLCGVDSLDDVKDGMPEQAAREYLVRGGMTEAETDELVGKITGETALANAA